MDVLVCFCFFREGNMLLDGRFIVAELVSNLYPLSAGRLAVLITFTSLLFYWPNANKIRPDLKTKRNRHFTHPWPWFLADITQLPLAIDFWYGYTGRFLFSFCCSLFKRKTSASFISNCRSRPPQLCNNCDFLFSNRCNCRALFTFSIMQSSRAVGCGSVAMATRKKIEHPPAATAASLIYL